jgi:hypothetical protein
MCVEAFMVLLWVGRAEVPVVQVIRRRWPRPIRSGQSARLEVRAVGSARRCQAATTNREADVSDTNLHTLVEKWSRMFRDR